MKTLLIVTKIGNFTAYNPENGNGFFATAPNFKIESDNRGDVLVKLIFVEPMGVHNIVADSVLRLSRFGDFENTYPIFTPSEFYMRELQKAAFIFSKLTWKDFGKNKIYTTAELQLEDKNIYTPM